MVVPEQLVPANRDEFVQHNIVSSICRFRSCEPLRQSNHLSRPGYFLQNVRNASGALDGAAQSLVLGKLDDIIKVIFVVSSNGVPGIAPSDRVSPFVTLVPFRYPSNLS